MFAIARRHLLCATSLAAMGADAGASADPYRVAGPWLDDRGQVFALDQLYGRPAVITLAYGACRRVCSTSLRLMKDIQVHADRQSLNLNFVVVGIDPSDRPQDWARWRADNQLVRANWHLLTGSSRSVRDMAAALHVRLWSYGDHVMHDLRVVLLSARAAELRFIDRSDQGPEALLG